MCQLGNYYKDFVSKLSSEGGQSKGEKKRMNKNVKFGSELMCRGKKGISVATEITHTRTCGQRLWQPWPVFALNALETESITFWMATREG